MALSMEAMGFGLNFRKLTPANMVENKGRKGYKGQLRAQDSNPGKRLFCIIFLSPMVIERTSN